MNSQIIVEQTKGAVAHACGVSVDEAFELILHSRNKTSALSVARTIVIDRSSLSTMFGP